MRNHSFARTLRVALAYLLTLALASATATTSAAAAATLSKGLRLVESNYLFEDELDAPRLLGDALVYLEGRVPELRAEPAGDRAHVLTAGPCRLRLEAPPDATLSDLAEVLEKAAAVVDRCVRDRPDDLPPVESLLLTGVLSGLDPYSTVFDADRKTEHTIQFRGKLAGVGARIGIRDEHLTLVTVYKGSPAYKAGLRDGDVVRRIDGHSTVNLPVGDAVHKIRGKVGTPVQLTVEREGKSDLMTFTVVRGLVTIPSVTARRLDSGVVYSAISHFSQTTPADFRARVSEAIGEEPVAGVIVDLRANSGGSMLGSSAIGDLFLADGLLITTAGRGGKAVSGLTAEIDASDDTPFADVPVAILTSPRTASGSELLAASLRNNNRTLLVGERTFGKGTVQKTYSLGSDSSLKITVGHFLPNGLSIPGGGLLPDIEVRRFRFRGDALVLPLIRESGDLPFWLSTPQWLTSSQVSASTMIDLVEEEPETDDEAAADAPDGDEEEDDPVVDITAELLARFGSVSATETLAAAREWLAELKLETDQVVAKRLAERSVDWRRPGAMAALESVLSPSLDVAIKPEGGMLEGGVETRLEVTATNTGAKPLYRVYGILRSDVRFLRGRGLLFGYLAPGQSRTWHVDVEPPPSIRTSRLETTVEFRNDAGLLAESAPIYLAVASAPRPLLAYRTAVTRGDRDDTMVVHVDLENRGNGTATDVRAFLKHPESEEIELIDSSSTVETLAPGDETSVELGVRLLTTPEEPVTVELVVSEPSFRIFLESEIDVTSPDEASSGTASAPWRLPPTIHIRSLRTDDGGEEFDLIAEVTDDSGLTSLWSLVGGKQVDYIDSRDLTPRRVRIALPWDPRDGVARVEIIATDADGLVTRYVSDL